VSPQHIVLVGMMASGKSAVGREVARRLGWPYLDNDELVTRYAGVDAAELLEARGLDALRSAESGALALALAQGTPSVVSAAAGTVLDPALRSVLEQQATVVFLRARPETLLKRIMHDPRSVERPRHAADLAAWLEQQSAERGPLYAAVADLVIDTDEDLPEVLAETIETRLREVRQPGPGAQEGPGTVTP
jgi:shikimate kinase